MGSITRCQCQCFPNSDVVLERQALARLFPNFFAISIRSVVKRTSLSHSYSDRYCASGECSSSYYYNNKKYHTIQLTTHCPNLCSARRTAPRIVHCTPWQRRFSCEQKIGPFSCLPQSLNQVPGLVVGEATRAPRCGSCS